MQHTKKRASRTGELGPNARLTQAQVTEIRERWMAGETQVKVARQFGITQGHVSAIISKRTWR